MVRQSHIWQLKEPQDEELRRQQRWLLGANLLLIATSLVFAGFWLALGLTELVFSPVMIVSLLIFFYSLSFGLVWRGQIVGGALCTATVFLGASFYISLAFLVTGGVVVALIIINLVFVSTFLGQRYLLLFIALSVVAFVAISLVQSNAAAGGGALSQSQMAEYLIDVVAIVLASFMLWLNSENNRRKSSALQASEERYRQLFEASPVALWEEDASLILTNIAELRQAGVDDFKRYFSDNPSAVIEMAGMVEVIGVNEAAVSLYKAADKGQLMSNLMRLVPPESAQFMTDSLLALANGDTFLERELVNMNLAGEKIDVLYRWSMPPVSRKDYSPVIISILDITERKQIEKVLQRYSNRLRDLHELDLAINVQNSPEDIAEVALRFVSQTLPCSVTAVWLFDFQEHVAEILALAVEPDLVEVQPYQDVKRYPLAAVVSEEILDDLQNGRAYQVDDIWQMRYVPPALAELKKSGIHSFLQVPLAVRGELIGSISLGTGSVEYFKPEHAGIVGEIAAPTAIAISNLLLRIAENVARTQAETLREVAANLNSSLDLEQLLGLILDQLAQVMAYDSAAIFMKQENNLAVVAQRDLTTEALASLQTRSDSLANLYKVFNKGVPFIVPDTRKEPDWQWLAGFEDVRCWLGLPLWVKGETIGLLSLYKSVAHFYSEKDIRLVVAFANQASLAIENAVLYRQARQYAKDLEKRVNQRTRDLSMLYQVTAVTGAYLDINKILNESLETLLAALDCYAGAIHVVGNDGEMGLTGHKNVPPAYLPLITSFASDFWLVKHILNQPAPYVLPDLAEKPPVEVLELPGGFSYAGVTMCAKGEVRGILSIVQTENKQFSVEDLALLSSVADHLGVAVENDRLRQQNRRVAVLEERERVARELHDSVTQSIYSLTLFAEVAHDLSEKGNGEKLRGYLNDIGATARQALKEMRLLLYELRSSALTEAGLVNALQYRLEAVEGHSGMEASIQAPTDLNISTELEHVLYRVAQEALNNTLKHARATAVSIQLKTDENSLIMAIEDNGQGMAATSLTGAHSGQGLKNMKNRIEEVGGSFKLDSLPGQGTKIEVSIDLFEEE